VRLTNTFGQANRQSLGSGVVFSPSGLVITNNHVIEEGSLGTAFGEITVESLQRVDRPASDPIPCEVIIRNEDLDLAILRIKGAAPGYFVDLLGAPSIDESLIERRIRILGYPPIGGGTITVTRGIVSGFDEIGNLKTDAEINSGNSGGAALDDLDSFLGIPSFIVTEPQGKLGFIITVDQIKSWLNTVLKSGLPCTVDQLGTAFTLPNLNFSDKDLDESSGYPRVLGKFAVVETLLHEGEYERVMPHINFILEKRPRSALAHQYHAEALLGLGRYVEAAAAFRISLLYDPGHVPALGNFGLTLIHLGRQTEALQIFEQIIDISDNPAELWASYHNIGRIYRDHEQTKIAEMYEAKAKQLAAAAQEHSAQRELSAPSNELARQILDAIVKTEIDMEDQK